MTRQRDIGRVLDAWLAPGPTEAPDRILDILADRIAEVPQRRLPRTNERIHQMTPVFKVAAVAALLLAIGLAVGPLAARPDQEIVQSPSPSAVPSSPPTIPVPLQLLQSWVGNYRVVEGLDNATDWALAFDLMSGYFGMGMKSKGKLPARASVDADGHLRLESTRTSEGCTSGQVGVYAWDLSERDTKLTITPVSDECATRADVLSGDFYTRDTCRYPNANFCLGPLDAGTHESVQFDLRGVGEDEIKWRRGAVSYTVPDGWANVEDGNYLLQLSPVASYDDVVAGKKPWGDLIFLHARPAALTTQDMCLPFADTAVGRSVDDLVAFLVNHPALTTSDPTPIIIDGFLGQMLDIDMVPTWTGTCKDWDGGLGTPGVPLWYDANDLHNNPTNQLDSDDGYAGVGGTGEVSDPLRVILLDVGAGDTLLIIVDSEKAAGQAAFVEQAMPIVRELRFPL